MEGCVWNRERRRKLGGERWQKEGGRVKDNVSRSNANCVPS